MEWKIPVNHVKIILCDSREHIALSYLDLHFEFLSTKLCVFYWLGIYITANDLRAYFMFW